MSVSYLISVDDDRDSINRSCEFNTVFLTAVRERAKVSNANDDAVNDLLLGFASQFLKEGQNARARKLFAQFVKASVEREAYLKAHPLPPIPEKGC